MNFHNKICIVTGGASGIGRAASLKLQSSGATVYTIDCTSYTYERIGTYQCDIKDYSRIKKIFNEIVSKEGHIDCVYNNAGIHAIGNVEDCSIDVFRDLIETNIMGSVNVLKAVIPIMKKQRSGSIVLSGSDQNFIAKTDSSAYGLTKAAIGQLAKSTALDYAPYNIRVNCICPGPVDTPMYQKTVDYIMDNYDEYSDRKQLLKILANRSPMRRIAVPEEIAEIVCFLLSDDTSYITGSLIKADGGTTLGSL